MKRGSILVLALWSLSLLVVFSVYMGLLIRQKIALVERLSRSENLHYVAFAGVNRAIIELNKGNVADVDSFKESWSNNEGAFRDVWLGNVKFSVSYGYQDYFSRTSKTMYGITDEERKININRANLATLKNLFFNLGLDAQDAQNLAACIIDWRDPDSMLSIPLGSAEGAYYENLPQPYQAKNEDFTHLNELLLVKGVSRGVFDKIKDFITIYGDGKVNINTATPEVLSSLGMDKSLVAKIIAFRYGADELLGTRDDGVFQETGTLLEQLSQTNALSDMEASQLANLASSGSLVTVSANFMIKSTATLGNTIEGAPGKEIVCVVKHTGEILSYAEF